MIYGFFWDSGERFIKIESSDAVSIEPEVIEKLLDEYRKDNDKYDIDGWCEYLEKRGYTARIIVPDYSIKF